MLNFNFDLEQLFFVVRSIFAPMFPILSVVFAVVLGAYFIHYISDIFRLGLWVVRKIKGKGIKAKTKKELEEIKKYGKILTERERYLLWWTEEGRMPKPEETDKGIIYIKTKK